VFAGIMPQKTRPEVLDDIVYTFESNLRSNYTPKGMFFGDVQLIMVKENYLSQSSNLEIAMQWKYWAPNLNYKQMEGNHMTILKHPYVNALAKWLKIQMEKYECPILK
jgi:thioesterase domain-containing protein